VALEPGYAPSHARLGSYRLSLGDLDGAERDFRAATVLDSSYPGGWVGLARVALQRDRSAEAIALLERLCKEDPEDRTFQQLLAVARQQAGGEGALSAESLLADEEIPVWNDPWELEVRAFRAKPTMLQVDKLLENGQTDEALALLQEERARGADDCATTLKIARVLQRMGRADESLREIEAALQREPENTTALLMKAQAIDDRGQRKAAVALLERVTELQPRYGGAFAAKGTKLFQLGEYERAVEAFRRAQELGENDQELRNRLGRSLIALKRWPEARAIFEQLVAERPGDGDVWLELAIVQLRSGSLAEAEKSIARGKATGTASPEILDDAERAYEVVSERRAKRTKQGGSR
jgi:tetratricopeptide (TPR) repeat protein